MTLVNSVTQILSFLTIAGQVIIVLLVLDLFFRERTAVRQWLARHALLLMFVVVLIATLGSLFYSEIAGYEPCKLCWLQRIFMYPQVIVLGLALWKKDPGIVDYVIALSAIGAVIAASHYYLQVSGVSILPCSAVGYSAACAQRFVLQFGYITIPMMALTAFLLVFFTGLKKKLG